MPRDGFRRFDAAELRRFLAVVDACMGAPLQVVLVGGSALAIGYEVGVGTTDVDTWDTDVNALAPAVACAREATGLDIPVGSAAVGDVPYHYESRLRRVLLELLHLEVRVLEKHDLALSKIMRCSELDLVGIAALHTVHRLDEETLVTRYLEEMDHAIGDPARLDIHLLVAVERLYGEVEAEQVRQRIEAWRREHGR